MSVELIEVQEAALMLALRSAFCRTALNRKDTLFVKGLSESYPVAKKIRNVLETFTNKTLNFYKVLVCYGAALLGDADEGFILHTTGIWYKISGARLGHCCYDNIKNIKKTQDGFELESCWGTVTLPCADYAVRNSVTEFLDEMRKNKDKFLYRNTDNCHKFKEKECKQLVKKAFIRFDKAFRNANSIIKKVTSFYRDIVAMKVNAISTDDMAPLKNTVRWTIQAALGYGETSRPTLPADTAEFFNCVFGSDNEGWRAFAWDFLGLGAFVDDTMIAQYRSVPRSCVVGFPIFPLLPMPVGNFDGGCAFPPGYAKWFACMRIISDIRDRLKMDMAYKFTMEITILNELAAFLGSLNPPSIFISGPMSLYSLGQMETKPEYWPHF